MDFLFDDDVSAFPSSNQYLNQSQYSSSGLNSFRCHVCGSQSFHEDFETSQKVCSTCFTQSQDEIFEIEEDDIEQYGAKRSGGLKYTSRPGKSQSEKIHEKRPLESFATESKELPSIDICLKGMRAVLTNGTSRLTDLMKLSPAATRNAIEVVRELWLAYIRAWVDAAEFYGRMHPSMRFCFRDYFLSSKEKLVRRFITQTLHSSQEVTNKSTEFIIEELRNPFESSEQRMSARLIKRKRTERALADDSYPCSDISPKVKSEIRPSLETEIQPNIDMKTTSNSIFSLDQLRYLKTPFAKMLQIYLGRKRVKGHQEAALSIVPSMGMVAALLWLAVNGTGISSSQICDWIRSGELPLMDAYRHLLKNKKQRDALMLCQPFFQLSYPPSPKILEDLATVLSIACRLEDTRKECQNDSMQSIPVWPMESLPTIIASTVAKVGLDQTVLDRALALVGIRNQKTSQNVLSGSVTKVMRIPALPAPIVTPDAIVRMDDVVAIIAIATQLDPHWRSMQCFSLDNEPSVPWNESQMEHQNLALESYLDYVEKFVFHTSNEEDNGFSETSSLLPDQYWKVYRELRSSVSDDESQRNELTRNLSDCVRASQLVGGAVFSKAETNFMPCKYERKKAKLIDDNPQETGYFTSEFTNDFERMDKANRDWTPNTSSDHRMHLLVQYLAYITQLDSSFVHRKIEYLLNLSKKSKQA